ncbi:MAG TPA: hypothetical protein VEY30_12680 [Myxococcaceae bacterium]|nr:hypothetical protein [Myxococcaceae bacterium]
MIRNLVIAGEGWLQDVPTTAAAQNKSWDVNWDEWLLQYLFKPEPINPQAFIRAFVHASTLFELDEVRREELSATGSTHIRNDPLVSEINDALNLINFNDPELLRGRTLQEAKTALQQAKARAALAMYAIYGLEDVDEQFSKVENRLENLESFKTLINSLVGPITLHQANFLLQTFKNYNLKSWISTLESINELTLKSVTPDFLCLLPLKRFDPTRREPPLESELVHDRNIDNFNIFIRRLLEARVYVPLEFVINILPNSKSLREDRTEPPANERLQKLYVNLFQSLYENRGSGEFPDLSFLLRESFIRKIGSKSDLMDVLALREYHPNGRFRFGRAWKIVEEIQKEFGVSSRTRRSAPARSPRHSKSSHSGA